MSEWQALLFGVIEGLTEYLPVSSTGHLILTQKFLGVPDSPGIKAFEIVIQSGAILAVLGVYAGHVKQLVLGAIGRSPSGLQLLIRLLAAFVPAAVLGLTFEKYIDKANLPVVASAWIVGGLAILTVEHWRRKQPPNRGVEIEQLSIQGAILIGFMQALSLCPGVSRSLVCLLGGLIVGLRFMAALEFSFLLGGITLLAASGYKGFKYHHEIFNDIPPISLIIGLLAATAAAFATVRWMLRSLERFGLSPFGWYRIALGIVVFTMMARGVLSTE
jgi:undecaprenyl-diphosphatase